MIANAIYRKQLVHRYDGEPYIKYFSAADFPGLGDEPVRFLSGENSLAGHWYKYGGEKNELIVFCHGIGGGHRSYMREIELLCRRGYTVFAYDCTGCCDSEGEDIKGFAQAPADLDAALGYLEETGALKNYRRTFVMGHSWGGYAAANIPACRSGIDKVVAISGFISIEAMLRGQLAGVKAPVRGTLIKQFLAIERAAAPRFADVCTLDTVKNTDTQFLFAHSTDDTMVLYENHTAVIEKAAPANARFIICTGKKHNPNYAQDAVDYMNETFGGFQAADKEGRLKTPEEKIAYFAGTDWLRMTAQDEDFWAKVFAFLDD